MENDQGAIDTGPRYLLRNAGAGSRLWGRGTTHRPTCLVCISPVSCHLFHVLGGRCEPITDSVLVAFFMLIFRFSLVLFSSLAHVFMARCDTHTNMVILVFVFPIGHILVGVIIFPAPPLAGRERPGGGAIDLGRLTSHRTSSWSASVLRVQEAPRPAYTSC